MNKYSLPNSFANAARETCMWSVFPVAVMQVLNYEPESELRSCYGGDLKESESCSSGVIEVSFTTTTTTTTTTAVGV
jgi:hypothetical protein